MIIVNDLELVDLTTPNNIILGAPVMTSSYHINLPSTIGTAGQVLSTSGTGSTSWITPSSAGTVTSVGLSAPSIFTITNSPVTSSGTLAITFNSIGTSGTILTSNGTSASWQSPATNGTVTSVSASVPTGFTVTTSTATTTPSIAITYSGAIPISAGGTNQTSNGSNTQVLTSNGSGGTSWTTPTTGTVTSVSASVPTGFTVTTSTATTTPSIAITYSGAIPISAGGTNQTSNGSNTQVLTSNGSGGTSWTTPTTGTVTSVGLSVPSIFTISGSPVTSSGTLSFLTTNATTGSGGLVQTLSPTISEPVISNTANANLVTLKGDYTIGSYNWNFPSGPGATGSYLTSGNGGTNAMTWTSTIPISNGGTNQTTNGTSGQYLTSSGSSSAMTWTTPPTIPFQSIGFTYTLSTNFTTANNTQLAVPFNTLNFGSLFSGFTLSGGGFLNSTGGTVGLLVTYNLVWDNATLTGQREGFVVANGVQQGIDAIIPNSIAYIGPSASIFITLTNGTQFYIGVNNAGGGATTTQIQSGVNQSYVSCLRVY